MVNERFYGPGENFLGWRCVSCGEILDEVILENRQAGTGRQRKKKKDGDVGSNAT